MAPLVISSSRIAMRKTPWPTLRALRGCPVELNRPFGPKIFSLPDRLVKTDLFRCDDGVFMELSLVMVRIVRAIVSTSALLARQSGTCNQKTIQLQVPGLELAPGTRMGQLRSYI